jgi:hypothetical protein
VRLIRLTPATPQQIRDLVLDDPSSIVASARTLARDVPVPGCGVLDLIAAEPGGRLTLVSFHPEVGAAELALALARWDWAAANLPALRALGGLGDADLTRDPRLVLVAPSISDDARRLAGRLPHPPIEILAASLVKAGETTAVLVEPVAGIGAPAPAAASVDPDLVALPPGPERSLLRRVVEELREKSTVSPLSGGVDVSREGRRLGSLVCTPAGVEARLADGRVESVTTDEDCRRVAALLSSAASPAPAPPAPRPVAAPLTREELDELGRGIGAPAHRAAGAAPPPAAASSMPPVVEN